MGGRGASSGAVISPVSKSGLPKLTGSEKQVSWANDIRNRYVDLLNEYISQPAATAYNEKAIREGQIEAAFTRGFTGGIIPQLKFIEKEETLERKHKIHNRLRPNEDTQPNEFKQWAKGFAAFHKEKKEYVVKEVKKQLMSQTTARFWIDYEPRGYRRW